MGKMFKLELTEEAVIALIGCLRGLEAKGRTENRCLSRSQRAVTAACSVKKERKVQTPTGYETVEDTVAKAGSVELCEEHFKYVKEAVSKKIDDKIKGNEAMGYDDLWEAIEAAEKLVDAAEKARQQEVPAKA